MVDGNKGWSKGRKRSKKPPKRGRSGREDEGPKPKRHLGRGSEGPNVSASAGKIGERSAYSKCSDRNVDERFILMEISLLSNFISEFMRCPECTNFGLSFCVMDLEGKNGFVHQLSIFGRECFGRQFY